MRVIGIDCATNDTKVGLALADFDSGHMLLRKVTLGSRTDSACSILTTWLRDGETPALLAVDAPFGWPAALAQALINHSAGEDLVVGSNELFRRATDRFIQARLSRTPLDVGADRIANLTALGELRWSDLGQVLLQASAEAPREDERGYAGRAHAWLRERALT